MANTFFDPGGQRAARVNDLLPALPPAMIGSMISKVLACTDSGKGVSSNWPAYSPVHRALDLCCGTGDLALGLAQRGAEVVGLDFSQPMLE